MGSGFHIGPMARKTAAVVLMAADECHIVQVDVECPEEGSKIDVVDLEGIEHGHRAVEVDPIELFEPDSIELPLGAEGHVDPEVVVATVGHTPHRRRAGGTEWIGMCVRQIHAKGSVGSGSSCPKLESVETRGLDVVVAGGCAVQVQL